MWKTIAIIFILGIILPNIESSNINQVSLNDWGDVKGKEEFNKISKKNPIMGLKRSLQDAVNPTTSVPNAVQDLNANKDDQVVKDNNNNEDDLRKRAVENQDADNNKKDEGGAVAAEGNDENKKLENKNDNNNNKDDIKDGDDGNGKDDDGNGKDGDNGNNDGDNGVNKDDNKNDGDNGNDNNKKNDGDNGVNKDDDGNGKDGDGVNNNDDGNGKDDNRNNDKNGDNGNNDNENKENKDNDEDGGKIIRANNNGNVANNNNGNAVNNNALNNNNAVDNNNLVNNNNVANNNGNAVVNNNNVANNNGNVANSNNNEVVNNNNAVANNNNNNNANNNNAVVNNNNNNVEGNNDNKNVVDNNVVADNNAINNNNIADNNNDKKEMNNNELNDNQNNKDEEKAKEKEKEKEDEKKDSGLIEITSKGRKGGGAVIGVKSSKAGKIYCLPSEESIPIAEKIKSDGESGTIKENDDNGELKINDLELEKEYNVYCIFESYDGVVSEVKSVVIEKDEGFKGDIEAKWQRPHSILINVRSTHPSTVYCIAEDAEKDVTKISDGILENSKYKTEINDKHGSSSIVIDLELFSSFKSSNIVCLVSKKDDDAVFRMDQVLKMEDPILIPHIQSNNGYPVRKIIVKLESKVPVNGYCQISEINAIPTLGSIIKSGTTFDCDKELALSFTVQECKEYKLYCVSFDKSQQPHPVEVVDAVGKCDPEKMPNRNGKNGSGGEGSYLYFLLELIVGVALLLVVVYVCNVIRSNRRAKKNDDYDEEDDLESGTGGYSKYRPSPTMGDNHLTPKPITSLNRKSQRLVSRSTDVPRLKNNLASDKNVFAELGMETDLRDRGSKKM